MHFLPDQNYDCVRCGRSCRNWEVIVDLACRGRLRGSELELRVLQETGQETTLVPRSDGQVGMARRGDACVYLDSENLCRIHAELGEKAKPRGCRQFPFFLSETPDGVFAGLSFYCTAVQQNLGRPLAEHEQSLQTLMTRVKPRRVGFEPIALDGEAVLDWPTYRQLEEFLLAGLVQGPPEDIFNAAVWGLSLAVLDSAAPRLQAGDSFKMNRSSEVWEVRFRCLTVLVGSQEATTGDEAWQLTEGLQKDQEVTLLRSRWTGRRSTIDKLAASLPPWVDEEIRRYLRSLVFRKFLALDRPVLQNVICLLMVPPLLRFYTLVCQQVSGTELRLEHYYQALTWLELDYSHTRQGQEGLWKTFTRAYREHVRLLRKVTPDA